MLCVSLVRMSDKIDMSDCHSPTTVVHIFSVSFGDKTHLSMVMYL
jgi:hypothetical protein